MRRLAGIYVWHGKAYLSVEAQLQSGIWMDIEPVYCVNLNEPELVAALEKVLAAGHLRLPNPTREEVRERKDPVLAATRARSWRELARTGAAYTISWTDKEVRVEISRLDSKGRWEYDANKRRILPPDASLSEIVSIILDDVRTRPDALK
ncbi:MAG: hypothetical protein ACRDIY_14075 [Chloroflexota bacterium]